VYDVVVKKVHVRCLISDEFLVERVAGRPKS